MKNKTPATKIGASVLATIAVILLSYLLLPKVTSVGAASGPAQVAQRKSAAAAAKATEKQARLALGGLPLTFEMNRGQFDPQVQFASRGAGYKAFLTQSETVFVMWKRSAKAADQIPAPNMKGATRAERRAEMRRLREARAAERAASKSVVRMSLAGGNPAPQVKGLDELAGKINYFRGNDQSKWVTDVPTFQRIQYANVYAGVDLIYYGQGSQLEYDLVVAPGANPSQIAFNFEGAERIEVDPGTGGLIVHAAGGAQLRQGKPILYQVVNGARKPISGGFTVNGGRAGFTVGDYDRSRPLVIDPVVFTYSTYLGGEENDRGHDVTVDADGNAYVVGWTESVEFPTKDGVQPGNNNFSEEAFITKFNPGGFALVWSTYLGGGEMALDFIFEEDFSFPSEGAYGVAIDAARNVYVTGFTFSPDFPTKNAMQAQLSDACCDSDSFITKLNAAGNQLVFSTYFGGSEGTDVGRGIAVDSNNNVYVTGYTDSFVFPTTNAIQKEIDGRVTHESGFSFFDAYVAMIDASGQFRVYSTYLGGPADDVGLDIAVDFGGNAYVTGWTDSTQPLPTPDDTASPSPTPDETATPTPPPSPTPLERFPTTNAVFQENPGGGGNTRDAFVTRINANGVALGFSTFLGGANADVAWGIALFSYFEEGERVTSPYVTGYTNSTNEINGGTINSPAVADNPQIGFPTTDNAYQPENAGGFDAFLTRLNPAATDLIYSTYIGGGLNEGDGANICSCIPDRYDGGAVAVDFTGNAYITGWTESTVGPFGDGTNGPAIAITNFPTKDAAQPEPGGSQESSPPESRDAFVSKFNTNEEGEDSLIYSTFLGGSRQDEGQGIAVDPPGNAYVTGWTATDDDCGECGCPCLGPNGLAPNGAMIEKNDFPTTAGAFQEDPINLDDAFLTKLSGGSSGSGEQGQGFIISGMVTRPDGTTPVPGVTITLTYPDGTTETRTTDAQGFYAFGGLAPFPEDPYIVTPSGGTDIYDPPSREIVITDQNERADFTATPIEQATPTPTPTPEESPTPIPSPTPTPTPTPTPSPTAASQAVNLSTRLHVLTGDQVGIGGFIITGSAPKHVIIRAIGPSLQRFGIPNPLPDPVLELHGPGSFATITNNNWRDTQEDQIKQSGIPPTDDLEAAIDITLPPGNYTGIIRGNGETTGIGLIEVYDLDQAAASKLANISTRGFVGSTPGDSIIAGFILGNNEGADRIVIRGLGPSLASSGVPNTLQNPTLELHDGDGALLFTNNDWEDDPDNAAEVSAAGLAPGNSLEAAIAVTLPPGVYTAILAGLQNTSGNGLVEIYDRGGAP